MTARFVVWLVPMAALFAPAVWAQQHAHHGGAPAKPAEAPKSAAPAADSAAYTSAFQGYRRFKLDEPMIDWRRINDDMAGLSGHAGHLRGTAARAESKQTPADHSQHGGQR